MTLKEKFKDVIDDAITYKQQEDSFLQLANDFAIGFAEWFVLKYTEEVFYKEDYTKELLEIYKKTL